MQEDVLYALNEDDACATVGLNKAKAKDRDKMVYLLNNDGAPTDSMRYLKTVYASNPSSSQWSNFIERVKNQAAEDPAIPAEQKQRLRNLEVSEYHFMPGEVLYPLRHELLIWASNRGQLLARTVRGMMAYRRALLVHADLGNPLISEAGADGAVVDLEEEIEWVKAKIEWQELRQKSSVLRQVIAEAAPEQDAAAAALLKLEKSMDRLLLLFPEVGQVQQGLPELQHELQHLEQQQELRRLLLEDLVDRKYQYVVSGQALSQMAGNKGSLKAQWTVHSMKLLCEMHPSLKVASIDRQLVMADMLGELKLMRDYSVLQRSRAELEILRMAGAMAGTEAYRYEGVCGTTGWLGFESSIAWQGEERWV